MTKEYTKQVMHNAIAHQALTNASPSPSSNRCPPANSPQFIYWPWRQVVWNIPLAILGQLASLCPLPASCAPPHWQSVGS